MSGGVTVDKLLDGAEDISAYIKEKKYDEKFILDNDIRISVPEHLYELETETVSGAHLKFPEVYAALFGKDFYADSGAKELSELPLYSQHLDDPGFFFDDWSTMGNDIIFSGGGSTNPDSKQHLDISTGGFMFFKDEKYDTDGDLKEIIDCSAGEIPNQVIVMKNNEKSTVRTVVNNIEKKFSDIFTQFGNNYEYRAGRVYSYSSADGTSSLYIDMEKYYKGVPFFNHIIGEYPVEGRRQFAPIYIAEADEPDHIFDIDCPYGVDRVISETELTGGLVSLPSAIDIMNNELSPKIKLNISAARLSYICDFDSADTDAALAMLKEGKKGEMTKEQLNAAGNPTLVPGRKYKAYPVWEFRMDKNRKDENGSYLQREACDIITVDVQTGKMTTYFDTISQR